MTNKAKLIAQIEQAAQEIKERQQLIDRLRFELRQDARSDGRTKVTHGVCTSIKDFVRRGKPYSEVSRVFGVSKATVSLIVNGKYKTKALRNV
jgi:DNA invertase Pin-like site-specific DNA recombinase